MLTKNITKALQTAQLLRQDLGDIVADENRIASALGLVLIKQVRSIVETLQMAQGGQE